MNFSDRLIELCQNPRREENIEQELGIEVELEGELYMPSRESEWWSVVREPSLRNGGLELILRKPIKFKDLDPSMEELYGILRRSSIKPSIRTSVHIHYNVCRNTLRDLYSLLMVYWMFEDVLVRMHGEWREGNLHCLRLTDAEGIFYQVMQDLLNNNHFTTFFRGNWRYAALNLVSVQKYGSIEYRFLELPKRLPEIKVWVEYLYRFTKSALATTWKEVDSYLGDTVNTKALYSRYFDEAFYNRAMKQLGRPFLEETRRKHQDLISLLLMKLDIAEKASAVPDGKTEIEQDCSFAPTRPDPVTIESVKQAFREDYAQGHPDALMVSETIPVAAPRGEFEQAYYDVFDELRGELRLRNLTERQGFYLRWLFFGEFKKRKERAWAPAPEVNREAPRVNLFQAAVAIRGGEEARPPDPIDELMDEEPE